MSEREASVPLSTDALPYAFGGPVAKGCLRSVAEDFRVDEILGFPASGTGEHVLLHIRKRNTNTEWLAQQLSRIASIPLRDIGYAGLKDRNAVTSQWFSLRLAGRNEPAWQAIESADVQILHTARHDRKLRRGALDGNRFILRLRNLLADSAVLDAKLTLMHMEGVPNYFGPQRFGHGDNNLRMAERLFQGELTRLSRHKRGLYLSAARSHLFNQVLAERVRGGSWNRALPGDRMMLDGTRSTFVINQPDEVINRRLQRWDIHPTGPLWGKGPLSSSGESAALEQLVLADYGAWKTGLEESGLSQDRRALRLPIEELEWEHVATDSLELRFVLPPGGYATTVLRELISGESAASLDD